MVTARSMRSPARWRPERQGWMRPHPSRRCSPPRPVLRRNIRAIIERKRREPSRPSAGSSDTVPRAASVVSTCRSGCDGNASPAGGGAAAAGSFNPSCDASLGRIFRADETHGSPRALRQFARAHNSLASALRLAPPSRTAHSNHERVSAQNCRKPICMHHVCHTTQPVSTV